MVLLFLCVFAVIAVGLSFALHSILGFFLAVALVVVVPLGYARLTGRSRKPSKGLYWHGYVSFMESSLTNKELFANIQSETRGGGWGRKGLSSGSCEIRNTGVRWISGGWATPQSEVQGSFDFAVVSGGVCRGNSPNRKVPRPRGQDHAKAFPRPGSYDR
jgi:hypothetical protein